MGLAKAHRPQQGCLSLDGSVRQSGVTPLYSMPHFSFTIMILPVSSLRKGFGLTGTVCRPQH